ncbi:MAG: crossover junction endodeoxyribonuclease RuvC [Bacteroidetes bacterium]|nr:crossover junction endodeoxyribonuclease RuvC [Bacteroidota bacterium]
MDNESEVILGIVPGTRYLGIAVMHDSELRDWRIKTFSGRWSSAKKKKILNAIERIINQHQVTSISLKKFHPSRSSKNLIELISEIRQLAKSKRLEVYSYTVDEIKASFSDEKMMNKKCLAKMLIDRNPEFRFELNQERKNPSSYHIRMFEAVALAKIYSRY